MTKIARSKPLSGQALERLEERMKSASGEVIVDPQSGDLYGYCAECEEFVQLHEGFCLPCYHEWEELGG